MKNAEKKFFKNYDQLAKNQLRKASLDILNAGLNAVETKSAVADKIKLEGDVIKVEGQEVNIKDKEKIFVIGVGKAALDAAVELEEILGSRIADGVVLDVREQKLKHLKSIAGSHPYPSEKNIDATTHIANILKNSTENDLIISIISGGGSALLCLPIDENSGPACDNLSYITKTLFTNGATIQEINTVRKHLSRIQGGQFAALAAPAQVLSLIFSDVPGNDISMVASGPTVLDPTTVTDAERVLMKYNVLNPEQLSVAQLVETPKDPSLFAHVHNHLIVSNERAVSAMEEKARELGYEPLRYSTKLTGEAREVGALLAELPKPGKAIIAAGETTVTVTQEGEGGRNLEVVLGALTKISPNTAVSSLASDGADNVPIAGAIADEEAAKLAKRLNLSPTQSLADNYSYEFVQRVGNGIDTGGPTGINVSDLMLAIKDN